MVVVVMTEDQFFALSGALIELNWSVRVLIAILLIRWVWGMLSK